MTAILEVFLGAFTLAALSGLAWCLASAVTSWRYLRARRKTFGGLRIVISNHQPPTNHSSKVPYARS